MEIDLEQLRPRYRLCQVGFALMALSIGLLCFSEGCGLAALMTHNPALKEMFSSPFWTWGVSAPITWASLIGSYLLWGRWSEPEWQRRAGLLVLMNFIDLVTWFVHHRGYFGLPMGPIPHEHLIEQVTHILQWSELLLMSGLATDLILHLGEEQQPDISRTAQTLSMIGLMLSVLLCLLLTNWWHWPLRAVQHNLITFMMTLGGYLLVTVTTFQVTALCMLAARRCGDYLKEIEQHAVKEDLLKSRSESHDPWIDT